MSFELAGLKNDPARLRDSLELLLDKPDYRAAAADLARERATMPTPAEVALDLLLKY